MGFFNSALTWVSPKLARQQEEADYLKRFMQCKLHGPQLVKRGVVNNYYFELFEIYGLWTNKINESIFFDVKLYDKQNKLVYSRWCDWDYPYYKNQDYSRLYRYVEDISGNVISDDYARQLVSQTIVYYHQEICTHAFSKMVVGEFAYICSKCNRVVHNEFVKNASELNNLMNNN